MSKQGSEWLTSSEASALVGIHPITLRAWADAGIVRLFRTPGGHRRFRRADLLAFIETKNARPVLFQPVPGTEQALAQIREQIGNHPIRQSAWYSQLSDEQRSIHRELGQRLLGLLLQFVSRNDNADEFLGEAQELARQYGIEAARAHLGSGELARAFLFFRRAIISATYTSKGGRSQTDAEGVRLLERINAFMDELLTAALSEYDIELVREPAGSISVPPETAPARKNALSRKP